MSHRPAAPPVPTPIPAPLPIPAQGIAGRYARRLLEDLGVSTRAAPAPPPPAPALAWARCGAMALTGLPGQTPRVPDGALAACADGVGLAWTALGLRPPGRGNDGAEGASVLLGERAALLGLGRAGSEAPGRSCRLLRAADGWVALNLARTDDRDALPAWLETPGGTSDAWAFARRGVATQSRATLAERAGWLGLPFAVASDPTVPEVWCRREPFGPRGAPPRRPPLVLDFTALWAGPLVGSGLADVGARVVKIESVGRPDGARGGDRRFFDLLNAGKASVAVDTTDPGDQALLGALFDAADVVLESTRPRALAQWGLDSEHFLTARPGRVWLSLTGYGRSDPSPGRVAFGDDAGVAAGCSDAVAGSGDPVFCGDAIADPLAGLHATLAVWAAWRTGGGERLDVSLAGVARHALRFAPTGPYHLGGSGEALRVHAGEDETPVAAPRARAPRGRARPLGADTTTWRRELRTC
ncbi:MAG: CoA transferase [Myxococcota bacterium]